MWPFSEMSLPTASLVGTIANWVLLASLVAGAVATFVIVKTSDVKEEHWDNDRTQAAERVAALNENTARLSADAEKARAEIASANARALEAQAELARFKAPRAISESDRAAAAKLLSKHAGSNAAIFVLGEGPEPNGLAAAILDVLQKAQWQALSWIWSGAGAATGVIIFVKPDSPPEIESAGEAIAIALRTVRIAAGKQPWPGQKWDEFGRMLNGPNPPAPTLAPIRIIIGSKPQ